MTTHFDWNLWDSLLFGEFMGKSIKKELRLLCCVFFLFNPVLGLSYAPPSPYDVDVSVTSNSALVTWKAPNSYFYSASQISGFSVTASNGRTCYKGKSARSCRFNGLAKGEPISFEVVLWDSGGASSPVSTGKVIPFNKKIPGVCGTANGIYSTVAPNGADLCLVGIASKISEANNGTFFWGCTGYRGADGALCRTGLSSGAYTIGQKGPGGGTVFYIAPDSVHGMEVGPKLSATGWGCDNQLVGATYSGIGSGSSNSKMILSACSPPSTSAVSVAHGYVTNGIADWYLPSQDEMLLVSKAIKIDYYSAIGGCGVVATSTEAGATQSVQLRYGVPSVSPKGGGCVYPVRSF